MKCIHYNNKSEILNHIGDDAVEGQIAILDGESFLREFPIFYDTGILHQPEIYTIKNIINNRYIIQSLRTSEERSIEKAELGRHLYNLNNWLAFEYLYKKMLKEAEGNQLVVIEHLTVEAMPFIEE